MYGDLTVHENLGYFARILDRRDRVAEVTELVGLEEHERSLVRDLSGGERSRASLAVALLGEPDLLVLDEPTSSLDPDIAEKTRRVLDDIRRARGLTILYTSHNMIEVEEMCDRVVFLHRGRVVADGSPLEVSRRILGSATLDEAAMEEVFLKIAREGAA